ncbi:MAG: polysaccharide export protein [Acidobacteriota bacterium]|nr:polysaccharide export protein [Acidobacteriota bacterium]
MRNIFFGCVILLVFACGLPAQEISAQAEADDSYVVKEDDILTIDVRGEPEYTVKERPVRMDGKISVPMLSDIHASGKTTKQLEEEITEKLKLFVKEPIVQVFVVKVGSHWVTLAGQVVGRTGRYAIGSPSSGSPTTVLEILATAGGLKETAKAKNITIARYVNGREVHFKFNYKDVLKGKNLSQNITLENRDYILVP